MSQFGSTQECVIRYAKIYCGSVVRQKCFTDVQGRAEWVFQNNMEGFLCNIWVELDNF